MTQTQIFFLTLETEELEYFGAYLEYLHEEQRAQIIYILFY
jgi:hypothetical protein